MWLLNCVFVVKKGKRKKDESFLNTIQKIFVELGDGVGDVPFWCRDGAYV